MDIHTSTHNLSFEPEIGKISEFLSEFFSFLMVNFSVYLNTRVFVMKIKVKNSAFGNKEHVTDRQWESRFY